MGHIFFSLSTVLKYCSAFVKITYDSAIVTPSDLVNEVEDVGFEAEIAGGGFEEEQKSSQVELSVMEQANSNVKKAFMSISGMTCSGLPLQDLST